MCIQTSTSAGLDHKAVGVAHFLLFVEGKAANPTVAGVLESIPVRFPTSDFQHSDTNFYLLSFSSAGCEGGVQDQGPGGAAGPEV